MQQHQREHSQTNSKLPVHEILKVELEKLKDQTRACQELTLRWAPNPQFDRHGEIKGTTIYIYDENPEEALHTLRHEFIDYYICKEIIQPLVKWINMQKSLIEDLIYARKENLVKVLLTLLK